VLLGILSAFALSRFSSLTEDAEAAALKGMAAAAGSAMVVNYAGCSGSGHDTTGSHANTCKRIRYCDDVGQLLNVPIDATTYTVTHTDLGLANGITGGCAISRNASGQSVSFAGISAGN
jgi:MSHA pilin protein MshA